MHYVVKITISATSITISSLCFAH